MRRDGVKTGGRVMLLEAWGKEKRIRIVIRFRSDGERKLSPFGNQVMTNV